MKRYQSIALVLSLATSMWMPRIVTAEDPPAKELLQSDSPQQKAIIADMAAARQELMPLLGHGEAFSDDAKRIEIAAQVVPLLQRIIAAYEKMDTHVLRSNGGVEFKFQPAAMLIYFGDDKALAKIKEDARSKDGNIAVEAAATLALCDWWKAAHDPAAQQKTLDSIKALARDHAKDDQITITAMMMAGTTPATPRLRDAAKQLIVDDLKGPLAQQIGVSMQGELKLRTMEGKPLVIAGKMMDGSDFTTAKWKGKVILVDFWASWCGPCKAELPRVKKAYADYHAKGLEVLGVSCDHGLEPLQHYLTENPEMAWPQLFDAAHPGWHALTDEYGIRSIPTMFLIDKAGIVRSITAREDFETLIPKMLAE